MTQPPPPVSLPGWTTQRDGAELTVSSPGPDVTVTRDDDTGKLIITVN